MVFGVTFNNISVISWWSVYWWRKPEYPAKYTDLPQVNDKLYRTDCIGSCKSNYHMIMTTTAHWRVEQGLKIVVCSSLNVPSLFRNLQQRQLTWRDRDTFLTHHPLYFTVMYSYHIMIFLHQDGKVCSPSGVALCFELCEPSPEPS